MPEGTVQPKIALPELDDDCKICGKETDSTAGNPSDWPVRISRHDGSGLRWTYHQGCVASALTQLSELRAASNEIPLYRKALEMQIAAKLHRVVLSPEEMASEVSEALTIAEMELGDTSNPHQQAQ